MAASKKKCDALVKSLYERSPAVRGIAEHGPFGEARTTSGRGAYIKFVFVLSYRVHVERLA